MTANTVKHESKEKETQLLTSEEQAVLSKVATKEPPHSQRAQALLAINEGATQAEAGVQAGLTRNQVRYWLTKFRANRTAIFPDELLIQAQQVEAESPQSSAEQAASPIVLDPGQPKDEEEVAQELPDEKGTAGPIDLTPVEQEETPKVKKKKAKKAKKSVKTKEPKKASKAKKSKKKTKKDQKASKAKKSKKKAKKDKKASKGKKSKKKAKKGKAQKTKGKKGKSSKKKRK
jgi:hypothetical protein